MTTTMRLLPRLLQLVFALVVIWSIATAALEAIDDAAESAQAEMNATTAQGAPLGLVPRSS